jgi:GAF domain-containing protein
LQVLCYPITNSRDDVIAVIMLINKKNELPFNRSDEELIAAFCAQLAVSIENVSAIDCHRLPSIAIDDGLHRERERHR